MVSSGMYRVWKLCTMSSVMQTSQNNLGFNLCDVPSVCCIVVATTVGQDITSQDKLFIFYS